MSDEEKKAIERINYIQDFIIENGQYNADVNDMEYFSKVLNLIEKQSKEIEELKEEKAKLQWVHIKENGEVEPLFYVSKAKIKRDYISKKKLYKHIEMLEKENCHENCGVKKLVDCGRQCSIGCTIKNIKKILEE